MAKPLAGIKVIELANFIAGPLCGTLLADMGADVIKVEPPKGDMARVTPPIRNGESVSFIALNRGKTSITCDLSNKAQRDALIERIGAADIFVHNLRADVPAKFGIDGTTLTKRFPKLVYADLGAFDRSSSAREVGLIFV